MLDIFDSYRGSDRPAEFNKLKIEKFINLILTQKFLFANSINKIDSLLNKATTSNFHFAGDEVERTKVVAEIQNLMNGKGQGPLAIISPRAVRVGTYKTEGSGQSVCIHAKGILIKVPSISNRKFLKSQFN